MRHRKAGIKLNRTSSHRQAMFRNMVTSLFKHERIRTTDVKAKELRRWADKMITLAKRGDLHARRQALSVIREKEVVHKLFNEAQERFGAISGGYTRIVKIGHRPGDAAPISMVELVSGKVKTKPAPKPTPKAAVETPEPENAQGSEQSTEAEAAAKTADTGAEPEAQAEEGPATAEEAIVPEADDDPVDTSDASDEIPTATDEDTSDQEGDTSSENIKEK